MTDKIKENAIRIAELKHKTPDVKNENELKYRQQIDSLSKHYSSYQGLMPIVFEALKANCDSGGYIDIDKETTETEFIEALQECVIKYLELRNEV